MFRIRRIYDDVLPVNRSTLGQVEEILRTRFPGAREGEYTQLSEKLRNPFKQRFRTILFVAETIRGKVSGFAILLHEPVIGFAYLDWIAAAGGQAGGGIGGALYDRVRSEAAALKTRGLFFECLPDEDGSCDDPALLRENRARLRFYERYGARPIIGTGYELPVEEGDSCMPHLVLDDLGQSKALGRSFVRKVIRAILERKYADYCPAEYVDRVVASVQDDPVRLRPLRYLKPEKVDSSVAGRNHEPIPLVVNDRHDIHHVHERGYVEAPVRVSSIRKALEASGLFVEIRPRTFADKHITAVHDADFVTYLKRACAEVPAGKSLYPYIFPIRNKTRPPREPSVLSGYYCIDTFTPINANAYLAARRSVDCVLTASREIVDGRRIAYALVRPPGHHAERRAFGGFCYFNNNAIAAEYLCGYGRVAILDIDYHHGNGSQDIFYHRSDVLTVSIHGHPSFAYPYFSGFEEERGEDEGEGGNCNLPLPEEVDGDQYRRALGRAISRIQEHRPQFLVVALGLDPAKGDPTGTWSLAPRDFRENGRMIGAMGLPIVVVQEGGYRTRTLGRNTLSFFQGLIEGGSSWADGRQRVAIKMEGMRFRDAVRSEDPGRIRRLVERTGFFNPEEEAIAEELVSELLSRGPASGYAFQLAEHYGRLAGYTCYGPIPGTASSFDLYWIAVHPDFQGAGLGRQLIDLTEKAIRKAGGTRIYAETSQRGQYAGTREFYIRCGYRQETVLEDFYGPGDGKAIYCKTLS